MFRNRPDLVREFYSNYVKYERNDSCITINEETPLIGNPKEDKQTKGKISNFKSFKIFVILLMFVISFVAGYLVSLFNKI